MDTQEHYRKYALSINRQNDFPNMNAKDITRIIDNMDWTLIKYYHYAVDEKRFRDLPRVVLEAALIELVRSTFEMTPAWQPEMTKFTGICEIENFDIYVDMMQYVSWRIRLDQQRSD